MGHPAILLYKLRFLFMGAFVVASLFLLAILLAAIDTTSVVAEGATASDKPPAVISEDPNVVTSGMTIAVYELGKTLDSAEHAIIGSTQAAASTTVQVGRSIGRVTLTGVTIVARSVVKSVGFVGRTVGRSALFVGRIVGKSVVAVLSIPGDVLGFVSDTRVVRAIIRPSDHVEVPIIDPNSPELHAAIAALPPAPSANQPVAPSSVGPVWPMHGQVTTEFGVAHRPFQRTHTGIDISDGRRSGTTPIKPFRPGRVIDTIRTRSGLGNHVIVDHGNGVTSVYAHLASIAVQVGQEVGLDTIIGLEGSTGVSTGTHLHFEIRVNGQAANPRQFISGQP